MNRSKLSALSALAALSLGAMSAQAKVIYHFNGNGASADAFMYGDGGGKDYSALKVSQGGTNQSPTTYLSYYSALCDTASTICTGIEGSGQIPNRDFTASSKSASLSTNAGSNPDFWAVKWTYNYSTGTYSESPISLGYFSLNWKTSGLASSKTVGTTTSTYLNETWKSTGQSSSAEATVTGSVGGTPFIAAGGRIGSNSNNDLIMERK